MRKLAPRSGNGCWFGIDSGLGRRSGHARFEPGRQVRLFYDRLVVIRFGLFDCIERCKSGGCMLFYSILMRLGILWRRGARLHVGRSRGRYRWRNNGRGWGCRRQAYTILKPAVSAIGAAHLSSICADSTVGNDIAGPAFGADEQHVPVIDTSDSRMQAYPAIMLWTEHVLSSRAGSWSRKQAFAKPWLMCNAVARCKALPNSTM